MSIDALVFDKDGTLFDFSATWGVFGRAVILSLSDGDEKHAAVLADVLGFDPEREEYNSDSLVITHTVDEIAEVLLPHLPGYTLQQIVDILNTASVGSPQVPAVPLAPFLEGLRTAGLKLGVATNDAEVPALEHLTSVGVKDHFDFVAGYDSGHGFKPGPGQLLAFAKYVDIEPSRIAMVGDSCHDLEAGRAAGMITIGVLTGLAPSEVLEPLADVVLPDIGHIPGWLATR